LCVRLCDLSSLEASSNDIPLSFIYKPKSISNPYPSTNPNLCCGSIYGRWSKVIKCWS
jgi:hypothetical protein